MAQFALASMGNLDLCACCKRMNEGAYEGPTRLRIVYVLKCLCQDFFFFGQSLCQDLFSSFMLSLFIMLLLIDDAKYFPKGKK